MHCASHTLERFSALSGRVCQRHRRKAQTAMPQVASDHQGGVYYDTPPWWSLVIGQNRGKWLTKGIKGNTMMYKYRKVV